MLFKETYDYTSITRSESTSGRLYVCPDGTKVPSVTTILDRTKPEEKRQALAEWRKRVGEDKATEITKAAAGRGTAMHSFLERYIVGMDTTPGSNLVQQQAHKMATVIIEDMLKPNVTEIWGVETNLYYPELYAGTTDCVGLWRGRPAIMDFKQTNKPKKEEWIDDYFLQLAAYAQAHDKLYGTNIDQGVIMMCSGDLQGQLFVLEGAKFQRFKDGWWDRVEQYWRQR